MQKREHYKSFFIRGFQYYEGAFKLNELKIGTILTLKAEPDNRHDENAVAIYYNESKLGYVPGEKNYSMSKLMKNGHNPFCIVVQQLNLNASAYEQVRTVVFVENVNEDN